MPRKSGTASSRPSRKSAAQATDYLLRIDLAHASPPIWRRVLVPDDLTLGDLHAVIQAVFPWNDSHLHVFKIRNKEYGAALDDTDRPANELDEDAWILKEVLLSEGTRFEYVYDFGDGWVHQIKVEKISPADPARPRVPVCITGKMAAPPDDSGGMYGFQEMMEAISDPAQRVRPGVKEFWEWLPEDFDPTAFSVEEANERLAELFGTGSEAEKSGPVWIGTEIDASAMAGPASEHGGRLPTLAIWIDVSNPEHPRPAAFAPGFQNSPESALVQALLNPILSGDRPATVICANKTDIEALRGQGMEGIRIIPEPSPEVAVMAQELFASMGEVSDQLDPTSLSDLVPVPGENGVTPELARAWCEATLACWKAKPWKRVSDFALFRLTFPGGQSRFAIIIGQMDESYGIVLMKTLKDVERVEAYSEQRMYGEERPSLEEMPPVLSLNYDSTEGMSSEAREYFAEFGPSWKRMRFRPYVLITPPKDLKVATAEEFRITGLSAAALALLAEGPKGSWPPPVREIHDVHVSWLGAQELVKIQLVRKG